MDLIFEVHFEQLKNGQLPFTTFDALCKKFWG
jgi:hypothetical protein